MQADVIDSQNDDVDSDNDSLFGSPPPSPGRGRSMSPLALPSGSAQNVGTLALPGSHLFSELPSAPLPAPSALTCGSGNTPQVTHQVSIQQPVPRVSQLSHERSSTAPPNRPTTPAIPPKTSRASKATKRSSQRSRGPSCSSTPRPTPPPISLPDPSEPPPSNFLRNQQALLGVAGLVGGVRPSNLRHVRGSTANNPIVVEDEDETPTIGMRPPLASQAYPTSLPIPPSQDIFQTLIKQKNIFPVVDALLRLVASNSHSQPQSTYPYCPYPSATTAFQRRAVDYGPNAAPPLKRRKLSSVPAGAADWDVPYPFEEGHGPADYRTNWERERGKQLIEDLVNLVKSAARKAAAKNFHQGNSQPQMNYPYRHYRPETMMYGVPPIPNPTTAQTQTFSIPSVPSPMSTPMPSARIVTTPDVPNAKHDHLCDSSEVASSHETPASASSSSSGTVDPSSLDVPFPTDSPEFDEFLQYLNGLPANDISNLFNSVSSSNLEGLLEGSSSTGVEQPTIPQPGAGSTGEMPQSTFTNHAAGSTVHVIDPTLLAISIPSQESNDSMSRGSTGAPPTPTLVGSPLSLSDPDPLTPRWDFTFPEPDVACSDTGDLAGGFEGGGGVTDEGGPSGNSIDFGRGEDDHAVVDPKGKGKARDVGPVAQPTSVLGGGYGPETSASTNYDGPTPPIPSYPPVQQASIHYPSTSAQQHFMPTAQSTSSFPLQLLAQLQAVAAAAARPQQHPPSTKVTNPNKADIIRRAQKMRNQLLAEVRRAKVELWETAMEGGCLALIAKDKSVVGNPTPASQF